MNRIGRVLCVDDDPQLLAGLSRNLRRHFPVTTAEGAKEALALLRKDRSYAVVISDMRMPGMDGAAFFGEAKLLVPNAVRILLTGEADMSAVIAAVNDGRIYRYLTKPIEKDMLVQAVSAAMAQYRLIVEQDAAVDESLRGTVDFLCNSLALASVASWGRAVRTRRRVAALVDALGLSGGLSLEAAAVIAEALALPGSGGDVRALTGGSAGLEDAAGFVTELVGGSLSPRVGTRVLLAARRLDALEATGAPWAECLDLLERQGDCDGRLLALLREQEPAGGSGTSEPVAVSALTPGMRLASPVRFRTGGHDAAPQGLDVTPFVLARLKQLGPVIDDRVQVTRREPALLAASGA